MNSPAALQADGQPGELPSPLLDGMPYVRPGVSVRATIGNLKGGVAKSTTAVHLAMGLAASGRRVLAVDADGTNRTLMKWSTLAGEAWPSSIVVMPWAVKDLARRVRDVAGDYDDLIIDTGPQHDDILEQALLVTDELIVPVAPSPMEMEQLADTMGLAAKVDAISPVLARVLLVLVRRNTLSAAGARTWLVGEGYPVMDAEIHMAEAMKTTYGTVPAGLGEYAEVLAEITDAERPVT